MAAMAGLASPRSEGLPFLASFNYRAQTPTSEAGGSISTSRPFGDWLTRLPSLCESSLNADPASKEADVKGLAKIIINAGESCASDTYSYILDELVKSYTDAHAVKVVTGCSAFYDNSKTAVEVTVEDLSSDHLADAHRGLILGFSYADDCKNSFSSAHPPIAYPDGLAQRQRDFQNLCGVATDIVQVIRTSNP
ncbi:cell wall / vacuolar inhibitor of fructosidase 2-like [Papaver somniferum]|uniref:cell wall / vacuolar inhibitor of fructosidase 2-like n=1 Tax=Papaver somniferum TaxID=3469 RepID=UPI000E6F7A62|nr:cell wall / vacuolar inhibitor of fructosidase 2-like [Papaver somniferum]